MDVKVMDAMFALLRTVFRPDQTLCEEERKLLSENIGQLYAISKHSDMAHLVGYALEGLELISPENEYYAKFQEQQYLAMIRCEGMEYELERIRDTFEKNKIKFIPLKGAIIRPMYPEPWMRTSSDIDVLVWRDDFNRAEECLIKELGYKTGKESGHDHSLHSPGGVHVELHFDLMEDDRAVKARDILIGAWDYARPLRENGTEHKLSNEIFYLYHVAHIAKHVEWAGMGMRAFLDLRLINNSAIAPDPAKKAELLNQASIYDFSAFCEEVSEHWFGDKAFVSETAKRLELFVLNCGTYGSMENRITIIHEAHGGTRGYILWRIFLPYHMLANMYPIIKKYKILTPIFEVVRWFKLLSKGMMKKAVSEVRISKSTTDQKVNDMKAFMSEIGL